jgi:hypothetical protein
MADGIPRTRTRQMAADNPWYGPTWGRARVPQERTRIPWPRRPTIPELARHHGEESSPSPSRPRARWHPPLPRGLKSPAWVEVAGTDRKATRPLLGGVSTGVHRLKAPITGDPCLKAEKRPHEGKTEGGRVTPVPSPSHQKTQI